MRLEVLTILSNLIKYDSRYTKSNKEIVDYIVGLIKNKAEIIIQKYNQQGLWFYNLIAKIKGEKSDNPLCLVGHTDTVEVSEKWQTNPFRAKITKDRVYGLGATDMKGALSVFISVISKIEKPKQDTYLILTADEENEGSGAKKIIKKLKIKNSRFIFGEATDLNIRIGQRGMFTFEILIVGRARHSGATSLNNNLKNSAIYKTNTIINALIKDEGRLEKIKDKFYGRATQNIGIIKGGISTNTVADKCVLTIERRFPPAINLNIEKNRLIDLLRKSGAKKWRIMFWGDAFGSSPDNFLIKEIKRLAKTDIIAGLGWTEACYFAPMGDCIIFGPGQSQKAHRANESVEIKKLLRYQEILKGLAVKNY